MPGDIESNEDPELFVPPKKQGPLSRIQNSWHDASKLDTVLVRGAVLASVRAIPNVSTKVKRVTLFPTKDTNKKGMKAIHEDCMVLARLDSMEHTLEQLRFG